MNFDETKQAINEQTPDFLEKARKLGYICPLCGSGSGKNGTGISRDKKRGNKYHCFSSNFDGDVIAIWQATHDGMNFIEAVKTAAEHYGLNYDGTPPARRTDEPRQNSEVSHVKKSHFFTSGFAHAHTCKNGYFLYFLDDEYAFQQKTEIMIV